MRMHGFPGAFACALSLVASVAAQQAGTLESEIAKVRREIAQVTTERDRNRQDLERDRKDYDAYRAQSRRRTDAVRAETDSLKRESARWAQVNDSLAALVSVESNRRAQVDLSQDALRELLAASCLTLSERLRPLVAPMSSRQTLASLELVRSELLAKSIDNIEGFNRIAQICTQAEEAAGAIQISQESSPVPELSGTVYRLRIGHLFEAAVDLKKTRCVLWSGNDSLGSARWSVSEDPALVEQVFLAATVREGKSLPDFVELPLGDRGGAR